MASVHQKGNFIRRLRVDDIGTGKDEASKLGVANFFQVLYSYPLVRRTCFEHLQLKFISSADKEDLECPFGEALILDALADL